VVLAFWALATAALAARRLAPAWSGWVLHLPIGNIAARQAGVLVLVVAQAVVIAAWCGLWVLGVADGAPARLSTLLAVVPLAGAAALATVPAATPHSRGAALAALLPAAWGTWLSLAGAVLLLGFAEFSGLDRRHHRGRMRLAAEPSAGAAPAVISLRALGIGALGTVAGGLLAVGFAWLVLRNNPELTASGRGLAVRLGVGVGMLSVIQGLAARLVVRRPAWPWSRSLPWSAGMRVREDARLLLGGVLAVVGVGAALYPLSLLSMAPLGVLLSLRGIRAMKTGAERPTSLGWRVAAEGAAAVAVVAVQPWIAALFLALVPLAYGDAVRSEQRWKVSLVRERQYVASGDTTC
jgi:hypothetical protein